MASVTDRASEGRNNRKQFRYAAGVVDGVDGASGQIVLTLIADPPGLCLPSTLAGAQVQLCLRGDLDASQMVMHPGEEPSAKSAQGAFFERLISSECKIALHFSAVT